MTIGFDGTWTWTLECDASGSSSYACGPVSEESPSVFYHSVPTCDSGAVSNTAAFQTAPSTTSDGRYTPPPSLDTSIYSVYTSTYTTILAAYAQSTTLTSTFQSTFTSTIGSAAGATTGAVLSSTPDRFTDNCWYIYRDGFAQICFSRQPHSLYDKAIGADCSTLYIERE